VSRFQFVADNSTTYPVKRLCELVEVTRSSFYAWQEGAAAREQRAAADAVLEARIRKIHEADNTVGAPRITAELNDGAADGERVDHKRVARVMKAAGIAGYVKKRKVRTTVPEPADQLVPDLLKRDFTADAPNRRYVGDLQCRRRHWMSYADLRTMPMLLTVMQVSDGRRTGRSA
jgi:transposase InsO family protein